jgi:hypothetical protein
MIGKKKFNDTVNIDSIYSIKQRGAPRIALFDGKN